MNKKLFLVLSIFLIGIISAQGVSYCCERLGNSGPWCQNAPETQCGSNYRSVPTSCEATSYCRLGVCINSAGGTCMPNTPQRVCDEAEGVWDEREKDDIPQCQLGCCLIGEQAAFVTLTRCKSLSSLYGLEINYRMDIQSEVECIASARPKVKGACVYEKEFEKTCEFLTKKECQERGAEFHEDYLCSANSLITNCAPRGGTTCVEGKDEVYSLDSCGNLGNVYDAEQWDEDDNDEGYWGRIRAPTCVLSDANRGSCGNCDYYLGSTCKKGSASHGNYICKDLGCEYEDFKDEYGRDPEHGETWCADAKGVDESLPGSRHFRLVCYNNEVSVESCADFRQEVCIQSFIGEQPAGGFKTAACRVNMWQDCYSQDNEKDCNNPDKRDCQWINGTSILRDEEGGSLAVDGGGNEIDASCVPLHAPGFDFWEEGGDAESMCSMASTTCVVQYETIILGHWIVSGGEENITCLDDEENLVKTWTDNMNSLCSSLGDCGIKKSYIGEDGYYDDSEDFFTIIGNLTRGKDKND